jgi:hypothetical protein
MRARLILLIIITQFVNYSSDAQVMTQGQITLTPYYGFPNFGKTISKYISVNHYTINNITGLGPMGLRANYLVNDKIDIGFDIIYNDLFLEGDLDSILINNSYENFALSIKSKRFRPQLRGNYHFFSTDNSDLYAGFGLGLNFRQLFFSTDAPGFSKKDIKTTFSGFPLSSRLAIGFNYFFTKYTGINVEFGIGGPIVSGGLIIKI